VVSQEQREIKKRERGFSEAIGPLPHSERIFMTFTEAAAHVLRLVGKPLHYKEITDVAIERGLLSHVGKSPEVTMGARLAAQVKKTSKDNPIARVKPGVFALSDWDEKFIEKGLADRTPALERARNAVVEADAEAASE